jgi:hypothetical protein
MASYIVDISIATTIVLVIIIPIIYFLSKTWVSNKIQYSIKHEFDLQIEQSKDDNLRRMRAVLIADLLSEWLTFPDSQKRLNQLTIEAFLWLPEEIAKKLSLRLLNHPDGPDVRDIIIDVRKYLLQKNDSVTSEDVIVFDAENKRRKSAYEKMKKR